MAHVGDERKAYKVLVGKRTLRRLRHRWEDGIRMYLGETGWGVVKWIHLAQVRGWWQALVNAMMDLQVLASQSW
jgi:hypothetical protein